MRKVVVDNPRYPHTIKIVRVTPNVKGVDADDDDPLAESASVGTYIADASGNMAADAEGNLLVVMPDSCEETLYEGKGRSFTDTTTNGNVEVDLNKRKASIPVRYDEWGAGKKPLDGDTIYATVGNNTEIGRVRDCEPDNNRSLVYWDFVRV